MENQEMQVITHFYIENEIVFLLSIYDKSEQTDIFDKELRDLLLEIEESENTDENKKNPDS